MEEAATVSLQALKIFFATARPLVPATQECLGLVVRLHERRRDLAGLVAVRKLALDAYQAALNSDDVRTTACVKLCSEAMVAAGLSREAEPMNQDWLKRLTLPGGGLRSSAEPVLRGQLDLLHKEGRHAETEKYHRQLIALLAQHRPADKQRWAEANNLAQLLLSQGRHGEAVPLLEAAVSQLETAQGRLKEEVLPLARRNLEAARKGPGGGA